MLLLQQEWLYFKFFLLELNYYGHCFSCTGAGSWEFCWDVLANVEKTEIDGWIIAFTIKNVRTLSISRFQYNLEDGNINNLNPH